MLRPITKKVSEPSITLSTSCKRPDRIRIHLRQASLFGRYTGKGHQILRYSHVPARYIAKQGSSATVYIELKEQLPQLKWLPHGSPDEALLFFTLEVNLPTVSTPTQNPLHSYDLQQAQPDPVNSPKSN